ncbi:LOW QUALITY PROTEIN: hypothetical protein HID58_066476, partial [Brassica napus]
MIKMKSVGKELSRGESNKEYIVKDITKWYLLSKEEVKETRQVSCLHAMQQQGDHVLYWIAGGTMRNVLVGVGRCKNKNLEYHITHKICEAMQKAAARTADLQHPNGTNLLTGGSDSVLCRSMVSALNVDRKVNAADTSHVAEDNKWLQVRVPLNMSNEEAGTISMLPKFHMDHYKLSQMLERYFIDGCTVLPSSSVLAAHEFHRETWNSFTSMSQLTSPSPSGGSGLNSPTLGKIKVERCLWVSKTMRIDNNSEEAARSLIWETLECIKNIPNKE